ncbi:hypothetical protein SAMN04488057_108111 [Cyclobacterium lianum]|uniref:Uncharacterized protein n=1 Tax=Cyclobacterium lianum TaxID=388280 RepID=A0A1M7PE17_9BACT|nr:hypothetical protein [Cyclobacterium lianum]SHN15263.1 hypothetical protein SAMN04488057_108111 [Cyclobacterium lianum]
MFRKKFGFDNQSWQIPNESTAPEKNTEDGESIFEVVFSEVLE